MKRIQKAKRVIVDMVAAILFFHMSMRSKVEALSLPPKVERTVMNTLILGLYINRVSKQDKTADDRQRLRMKSQDILVSLRGE